MDWLTNWWNKNTALTHWLAGAIVSLIGAYNLVPQFQAGVDQLYALFPTWGKTLASTAIALYIFYRNGQKTTAPITPISDGPAGKIPPGVTAMMMLCLCVSLTACPAFSTVLGDIGGTITKFAPLLLIAEGAACAFAGPACTVLTGIVNQALPLASGLAGAFSAWSSASAAAQPGLLPQVIAAVTTWQAQLKQGLAVPGLSASATAILEAELNYANDILITLQAAEQGGGTSAALARVIDEATPIYDDTGAGPATLLAVWNPVHLVKAPRGYKLKNGATVHAWAYHCDAMYSALQKKSGNPTIDKTNAATVAKIKALNW